MLRNAVAYEIGPCNVCVLIQERCLQMDISESRDKGDFASAGVMIVQLE